MDRSCVQGRILTAIWPAADELVARCLANTQQPQQQLNPASQLANRSPHIRPTISVTIYSQGVHMSHTGIMLVVLVIGTRPLASECVHLSVAPSGRCLLLLPLMPQFRCASAGPGCVGRS